jgi:hypothetical protein
MPELILEINGYFYSKSQHDAISSFGAIAVCFSSNWIHIVEPGEADVIGQLHGFGWECHLIGMLDFMFDDLARQTSEGGGSPEPPPEGSGDSGGEGDGGGAAGEPFDPPDPAPVPELPPAPPPPPPVVFTPLPSIPIETFQASGQFSLTIGKAVPSVLVRGAGAFLGILLGGIFGGDSGAQISKLRYDLVNALNAIWTAIKAIWSVILKGVQGIAKAIGAMKRIWEKIIKPLIQHIHDLTRRLADLIDRVLTPYFEWIRRVRQQIMDLYVKVVMPVLNVIHKIRKALAILRLANIEFAKKLDDKLAKIEGKLTRPIQVALEKLNDHGRIINTILNIQNILQEPLFTRTLSRYGANIVNAWWTTQTRERTGDEERRARELRDHVDSMPNVRALETQLRTGIYVPPFTPGPRADELRRSLQGSPQ